MREIGVREIECAKKRCAKFEVERKLSELRYTEFLELLAILVIVLAWKGLVSTTEELLLYFLHSLHNVSSRIL